MKTYARRGSAVELGRQNPALVRFRIIPIVLDFHDADDICAGANQVRHRLGPLAVEFVARVRVYNLWRRRPHRCVRDVGEKPYWTKYQRFLCANSFPYSFVDIHVGSWIEKVRDLDMVVWRPTSQPCELDEARRKIFYMQEFMGLSTYPTLRAINMYEDKVLQSWALQAVGADTPATVASFSETDALREIAALGSEVVWKITTGAGSAGVEGLSADRARAAVRRAFSARGEDGLALPEPERLCLRPDTGT